jgi:hypothetical protein
MARKVIEGKAYDTETATFLAEASGGGYSNDFSHWEELLYRTPRGRLFVAGNGGALSRWSEAVGQNSWTGGSGIRPLSEGEARQWVETNSNSSFETIFGEAEAA